ncbi:MAG: hypothetical protein HY084_06920 [Gemmatimonadetes bacterium]|nr:hypothetical protein [Gemmatimonadota bacterium]
MRWLALALAVVAFTGSSAHAQVPLQFSTLQDPATLDAPVRSAVVATSIGYRLAGFRQFAADSVLLVYDDSSLTAAALRAHKWMFGPPTTVAENDGCPPEKVLGRKIARALWRQLGRPKALQQVMIAVRGTVGTDRWTTEAMFYYPEQLDGPWVGDAKRP